MPGSDGGAFPDTPWLLDLAISQPSSGPDPALPRYDVDQQMTFVQVPRYQLAIDATVGSSTKKADRETGEDQKGF